LNQNFLLRQWISLKESAREAPLSSLCWYVCWCAKMFVFVSLLFCVCPRGNFLRVKFGPSKFVQFVFDVVRLPYCLILMSCLKKVDCNFNIRLKSVSKLFAIYAAPRV